MLALLFSIILVAIFYIMYVNIRAKAIEKKEWNKGICPHCGEAWVMVRYTQNAKVRIYRCRYMHKCTITFKIDNDREEL